MTHRSLEWRRGGAAVGLACAALLALPCHAQPTAATGPHFIHGSWVNVREAADARARAIDQLVTNTPVTVVAREGIWCRLSYGAGKTGFAACNLLGPQALSLAQTSKEPARAFWVAPSPKRLAAYGQSLLPPAALRLEVLKKTLQAGDFVRYPAMSEFEAAKKLMKAGVLLNPAQELERGAAVDMAAELRGLGIKPAPIRPSFFRSHASVALVSEADADGLAAVGASKISVHPKGLPTAWFSRHNGPEIEGITGFWDVGDATLTLTPPLHIYSVAANGLVGAAAVSKLAFEVGGEGHYCGARYTGTSLALADYLHSSSALPDSIDFQVLRDYPALKEGTEVLARFALPQKLAQKSVKIKTQSQPVNKLPGYEGLDEAARLERLHRLKPRIILREIDLDGDGVADLMQLETPLQYGEISLDLVLRRNWYVNILGQWFKAGEWEDQDCT
ncbi:SH3 domain-containing protein [Paucibacter sp. AS339]|uniref:SH3 domain-containing protein n=1 Tax=Paucibacter hankyongi TaxID=3133434 RepID=UPI00309F6DFB